MSTTDLKIPGASIYPSSGPRRWLPTPDGHRLPPLRDLIAAHDSTTRKSNFLLSYSANAGPVSGDISDVVDLPVGASATYTATCSIAASATGTLSNTATIAPPPGIGDPVPGNNQATDDDTVLSLPVDLILVDDTVVTTKVFVASNSITAGPDFSIVDPGDVTFRAGAVIILRDSFSVGEGAEFTAEIDPYLRASPTRR